MIAKWIFFQMTAGLFRASTCSLSSTNIFVDTQKKYRLLNDTWTGNEPRKVSDLESSHCFIRRILLYLQYIIVPTKYHSMNKMIHVYHVNIHKLFKNTINIWIILNISQPYRLLFEPPQKTLQTQEKTKLESSQLAQPGRCKMCFCQVVRSLMKKWSRDESILSSLMVFNNKAVGVTVET